MKKLIRISSMIKLPFQIVFLFLHVQTTFLRLVEAYKALHSPVAKQIIRLMNDVLAALTIVAPVTFADVKSIEQLETTEPVPLST